MREGGVGMPTPPPPLCTPLCSEIPHKKTNKTEFEDKDDNGVIKLNLVP